MSSIFYLLGLPDALYEVSSPQKNSNSLDFLKFPTVAELNQQIHERSLVAPPEPKGLFENLLQGRAEVLYQELQEDPERFEGPVKEVLESMLQGRSLNDLSKNEKVLLDNATMAYAQTPPSRKKEASVKAPSRAETAPAEEEETAEAELPPYWWL